jgi:hypothetical protein
MFISRRTILKTSLKASAAAALSVPLSSAFAQSKPSSDEKLILSAPLTHSDWMLKPGIAWGPQGVRHMLDACKACGWSRVHWRALDGGRACYASKLVRPSFKVDPESSVWSPKTDDEKAVYKKFFGNVSEERRVQILNEQQRYDYATFDTLAEAVRYGHSIGLQIHAWASINEDDHGWGIVSDFARDHPQFRWIKRGGTPYHSQMSFAFPEVRAYKLGIIDELLAYDIDGLFLDWIRTGDIRDNPQTDVNGVADSGYETPLVAAFKQQFGVDPRDAPNGDEQWVRVRAEPQTIFMRDVRKRVAGAKKKVPLAVMVGHPWHYRGLGDKIDGNLRGLLLDVKTWAREGLIDHAVAAGYYRDGGNAELAYNALRDETEKKVDVWTYAWVPQSGADFDRDAAIAQKVGAKQILFWEADYIDDRSNAAELKAAMRKRARGFE